MQEFNTRHPAPALQDSKSVNVTNAIPLSFCLLYEIRERVDNQGHRPIVYWFSVPFFITLHNNITQVTTHVKINILNYQISYISIQSTKTNISLAT